MDRVFSCDYTNNLCGKEMWWWHTDLTEETKETEDINNINHKKYVKEKGLFKEHSKQK